MKKFAFNKYLNGPEYKWPLRMFFSFLLSLAVLNGFSQDQIIGDGFTGSWVTPTNMAASAGGSQIYTSTPQTPGSGSLYYFRFLAGGNQQSPSAPCTPGDDLDITASFETPVSAANTNCNDGAYYINCPNTTDNYVFKTPNTTSSQFVFFRVQGVVETIDTESRLPSGTIYFNQDVNVTANLSGALSAGQAVYVRYSTTSTFTTSTVVPMTGAGTVYTANIPAAVNTAGATIYYYFFTSGATGVATDGSNADFFTINLLNNGGTNYNYSVSGSYVSITTGNYNNPATWQANAVPPANSDVVISNTHNVTLDGNHTVNSLTINTGGTFTASDATPRTLTIASGGTIASAGTFTDLTGTVAFQGTATLSSGLVFNNVTALTAAIVGLDLGASTINGVLEMQDGRFLTSNTTYGALSTLRFNLAASYSIPFGDNAWPSGTGSNVPQNVEIVGGGNLSVNDPRTVKGNILISASTLSLNASLDVNGDWTNAGGTFTPGTQTVSFVGTGNSQINAGGATAFYGLTANKTGADITMLSAVSVSNALTLTNGIINTGAFTLTFTNTASGAVTGASTASFVNGILNRSVTAAGAPYLFPVGVGTTYLPFTSNTIVGATTAIALQAFSSAPAGTADGTSLSALSTTEYWRADFTGTYTDGTVSLGRQAALGGLDIIARSTTDAALSYNAIGGTVGGTNINASTNTGGGTVLYFAMATGQAAPTIASYAPTSPTFAGQPTTSGYVGQTITITGTNFTTTATMAVSIGGANLGAGTFTVVGPTSITAIVPASAATGTVFVTNTSTSAASNTEPFTFLGYITNVGALYITPATWLGGGLPPAGAAVTIAHNPVTLLSASSNSTPAVTILTGATLDVNTGGVLNIEAAGTLTNNGTFSSSGTGTVSFAGTATVSGGVTFNNITALATAGAIGLNLAGCTVDGTLEIQNNRSLSNVITYGPASLLRFSGGATAYNVAAGDNTWSNVLANAPQNVEIAAGTVNINQASTVKGNLTLTAGTFALTAGLGVNGNWTRTGGTFTPGTQTVSFIGTGNSQINAGGATAFYNLTINKTAATTLASAVTVTNALTLTNGIVNLGNFDLTVSNSSAGGAILGAFGNASMIATTGTGQLKRAILAGANNYIYPIGDATNYSPISLNFTANSALRVVGTRVVDATSPNMNTPVVPADYLTRYWLTTENGIGGTYSYNTVSTYIAGVTDVTGLDANLKTSYWNGTSWADAPTIVASPVLTTTTPFTQLTGSLVAGQFSGRNSNVNFTWTGNIDGDWSKAGNWSPASVPTAGDNIIISTPYTNPLSIAASQSITDITLSGTASFSIMGTATLSVSRNFTSTSTATAPLVAACGTTVAFTSSSTQTIPAFSYGNLVATGGPRTLANGNINICGNYTPSAGTTTTGTSTVNFNGDGSASQTISTNPAAFYNLVISNPGAGLIGSTTGRNVIAGAAVIVTNNLVVNATSRLDMAANTLTATGTTANVVNGFLRSATTAATTITGMTVANLTFGASGGYELNSTTVAGIIPLATWSAGSTCYVMGYTTNTAAPANITQGFSNFTWNCTGQATNIVSLNLPAAPLMSIAGELKVLSSGTTGELRLFSNNSGASLTVSGKTTLSGGSLSMLGGVTAANKSVTLSLLGDLEISGGKLDLASTATNFSGTRNGHTSIVKLAGNLLISSGSIIQSATNYITPRFIFNGTLAPQTFNSTATGVVNTGGGEINWAVGEGGSTIVELASNFIGGTGGNSSFTVRNIATFKCINDFSISGLTGQAFGNSRFTLDNGATLEIGSPNGITETGNNGSVRTANGLAGQRTYNTNASYIYKRTDGTAQVAGNGLAGAVNLTINNSGGVTLSDDVAVSARVDLLSGNLILAGSDLILGTAANAFGTFSSTRMIVANGGGHLVKSVAAGGSLTGFQFPIGEITGTTEFSPVTVTLNSSTGTAGSIGFGVEDDDHPYIGAPTPSDYLSRYWPATLTGFGTYTWSGAFTFNNITGDIVGTTPALLKPSIWNPAPSSIWVDTYTGGIAGNILTINAATGSLANDDYAISARATTDYYYRTRASGLWSAVGPTGSWETSTTSSFAVTAPAAIAPTALNSAGIFIRNTHAITVTDASGDLSVDQLRVNPGGALSINVGFFTAGSFTLANNPLSADPDLTIDAGGLVNLASINLVSTYTTTFAAGSVVSVDGTLRNALEDNRTSFLGAAIFNSGSVYEHAVNGGDIIPATWNGPNVGLGLAASLCRITGNTSNAPATGLTQSFYDFTWNCAQTTNVSLTGGLTTINGDFTMQASGTSELRLFAPATPTGTLTVGGRLNLNGGTLVLVNKNTPAAAVNLNHVLTVTGLTNAPAAPSSGKLILAGAQSILGTGTPTFNANGGITLANTTSSINLSANTSQARINIRGDLSITANPTTGALVKTGAALVANATINFVKAGSQDVTISGANATQAVSVNSMTFNVGDGTAATNTNVVNLKSDFIINTASTFTVKDLATLDCGVQTLRGATAGTGTFTLAPGGNLRLGSPYGITATATGALGGNIQTLTRSFSSVANYTYNGSVNQAMGNFVTTPTASTVNLLTIANTGTSPADMVTLTTTGTTANTLNLTSGRFAAGSGQTLNIAANGVVNGNNGTTILGHQYIADAAGGTIQFNGPGTLNGTPELYNVTVGTGGGVDFVNEPTIHNSLTINKTVSGAIINNHPPKYAAGSSLIFNSTGTYARGPEWDQATALDPGYPHHVTVQNGTTVNLEGASVPAKLEMGGNLVLGTATGGAGSITLGNLAQPVIVLGDMSVGGNTMLTSTITTSTNIAGNIDLYGDYTRLSANSSFAGNTTTGIAFKGGVSKSINATPPTLTETFTNVFIDKTSGTQTVSINTPVRVSRGIAFSNGIVENTSANALTLSAAATATGGSASSFVNGPLVKETDATTAGSLEFTFPIGKTPSDYQPAGILPVTHVGTTAYKAEFFPTSTAAIPLDPDIAIDGALQGILSNKYWDISNETVNAATARVVLYYAEPPSMSDWRFVPNGVPVPPFPSATNVAVAHHEAGGWKFTKNANDFSVLTPPFEAIYYQNTDKIYSGELSSFSPFTIGFGSNIILPIKLISFEGRLLNNEGALTWKIADATELAGFELEYSSDGTSFKKLADVAASASTTYGYLDKQLPQGSRFYRLLIKEKNGNSLYSAVIMLTLDGQKTSILGLASTIVNQPSVTGKIISAKPQGVRALVSDVSGKRVIEQKGHLQAGNNRWLINTGWLASGMYFVTIVTDDGVKSTLQFVKE